MNIVGSKELKKKEDRNGKSQSDYAGWNEGAD